MRDFDPVRLGKAEADGWVGYYRRRWGTVLRACVGMVRAGFGMSWPSTLRGAWWVLRANQVWAPYPDNDPDAARAYMRRLYALVARTWDETFDPAEAARLDVEWWRVHRAMQHEELVTDPASADPLTEAVAALYGYVYGMPAEAVREAAELRAEAMRISDRWVAEGCDPASPAIAAERDALIKGYASLRTAVTRV